MENNKFVQFFKDKDDNGERQRWMSNTTFILAAIGSAIGLGNFWRFPYLCYKWGGGLFFVPYLFCLIFLGIPMLMLEFALGQKFQRGDIGVFRGIHPRLAGVGLASVFCSYSITFYYNVIISWALIYFFCGFMSPLPWSVQNATDAVTMMRNCPGKHIAEEFFFMDILHIMNEDCSDYDTKTVMGQGSIFCWQVFLCVILTWFLVYWCVFKGVKSSSYVVWITVPLPMVFVFFMVLNGLALENSDQGIRMYLRGEQIDENGVAYYQNVSEMLSNSAMWAEACAQIFFSIGVCMGVMTSYASYNDVNQPIISNAFRVAFGNSCFSFFAGFAVFGTVGYLQHLNSGVRDKISSIGLAFVAYPAAIETMPMPNLWTIILGITLFTLGVDSAFSMVEATSTVITDTKLGKTLPRKLVALILCATGCCCSFIFCFNWGFTYFDTVDHYLAVYLMLLLGIFQAFGAGWVYQYEGAIAKAKVSTMILFFGYWCVLIPLALLAYFAFPLVSWIAMPIFWVIQVIVWIASFATSKMSFKEWYCEVLMYGIIKMARAISKLSVSKDKPNPWWKAVFEVWWCFSIKFFFPWAVWWLLSLSFANDISSPYGGYYWGWQVLGFLFPIIGLALFIIPIFVGVQKEPFEHDIDAAFDDKTVAPIVQAEMAAPAHAINSVAPAAITAAEDTLQKPADDAVAEGENQ